MNLSQIRSALARLIQDTSYDDDDLDEAINKTLLYAGLLVQLPSLKRIDTIDTSTSNAYVSLTTLTGGFKGNLRRVKNSDGEDISIYPSLDLLMDEGDMDDEGDVEAVAVEGTVMWYRKLPATAETLTLMYYRSPSQLTGDSDSPDDFPEALHHKLFVNGTAWTIYDEIEDGIDEDKVNTKNQFWHSFDERNKHSGITKLKEWIARSRRHYISSTWDV